MSHTDSDFMPSEEEEEEEERVLVDVPESSDDDYSSSSSSGDDEGGTFFDEEQDPLAFLQGMEASDKAPYELLRRRNRRRSRRLAAQHRAADEEDHEYQEGDSAEEMEEEEEEEEEEEGGVLGAQQMDVDGAGMAAGPSHPGPPAYDEGIHGASDGEEGIHDEWNEALAEQFGLAPPTNRRKTKSRDKFRRKGGGGRRRRDLPEEVSRKLGEANILYATQSHQEAIALLQEVVRLAPNAADAYHLLGLLYEEVGDAKRSLNFFMIAAHLTPKQVDLWRRLATMSSKQGLVRQAVYCLTQVIKRDRDDVDARYDRALLLAGLGQRRKAIEGLETVRAARPEHPEVAKQLARLYYQTGQVDKAAEVLKKYWDTYPETTDLTHVNLLAELLCTPEVGSWQEALEVLGRAKRELLGPGEEMPVELEVKAGLATARLGDVEAAEQQLDILFTQPVAMFDDLYLAAADTFESLGRDEKAEPFLRALADDPVTSRPDVWRRLAECSRRLRGPGAAVKVWQHYTEGLDPGHFGFMDAVVALADAMRAAGDEEGAAHALERLGGALPSGILSGAEVLTTEEDVLQRASVLKACGREDLLVNLALPSLQTTLGALAMADPAVEGATGRGKTRGRASQRGGKGPTPVGGGTDAVFLGYMSDQRRRNRRRAAAAAAEAEEGGEDGAGGMSMEEGEGPMPGGGYHGMGVGIGEMILSAPVLPGLLKEDESFQLLVDTTLSLLSKGRAKEARQLAELAVDVLGRKSPNRRKRDTMRLLAGKAALADGDLHAAMLMLKSPATRWNASPAPWNEFAQVQAAAGGARQSIKFLSPLRARNPASLPLALMVGHAHLQTGAYAAALGDYSQAYRFAPDEPLVLLCIAVALVNQAASRHVPNRNAAVLQAFGFIQEYSRRRRDPVEAAYNAGRAAQHLSLNYLAVPLYEKALAAGQRSQLDTPAAARTPGAEEEEEEDGNEDDMLVDQGQGPDAGLGNAHQTEAVAGHSDGAMNQFEVTPEAAFNLSLILKASGAPSLARKLLREHLTF